LPTSIPGVELRELTSRAAVAIFDLVARNRAHLTRFGDYEDLTASTLEDLEVDLSDSPDGSLRMGIWRGNEMMGRVDLNRVAPRTFVLGYWIGAEYTGNGYVTEACRALMDHSRRALDATEFWAGVRHVNHASAGVVRRLGFSVFEELATRTRYRFRCS
jgi:ribosomal-protein-serine acetyltransferase